LNNTINFLFRGKVRVSLRGGIV